MDKTERHEIIRARVYEVIHAFLKGERINLEKPLEDTDVFHARGLDSMDMGEIALWTEVKFEDTISISPEDLSHIVSVQDLIDFVERTLPENYPLTRLN